jgi:hypothetical protein
MGLSGTLSGAAKLSGTITSSGNLKGSINNGNTYVLPIATSTILGGVIIGDNITEVTATGKISVYYDNVINALGFTPPDTAISNTEILEIMNK